MFAKYMEVLLLLLLGCIVLGIRESPQIRPRAGDKAYDKNDFRFMREYLLRSWWRFIRPQLEGANSLPGRTDQLYKWSQSDVLRGRLYHPLFPPIAKSSASEKHPEKTRVTRSSGHAIHGDAGGDEKFNRVRVDQGEISKAADEIRRRNSLKSDLIYKLKQIFEKPIVDDYIVDCEKTKRKKKKKTAHSVGDSSLTDDSPESFKLLRERRADGSEDDDASSSSSSASSSTSSPEPGFFAWLFSGSGTTPLPPTTKSTEVEQEVALAEVLKHYLPAIVSSYVSVQMPLEHYFRLKETLKAAGYKPRTTLVFEDASSPSLPYLHRLGASSAASSGDGSDDDRVGADTTTTTATATATTTTTSSNETDPDDSPDLEKLHQTSNGTSPIGKDSDFNGNGGVEPRRNMTNRSIDTGYSKVRQSTDDSIEAIED